jgi:DNA-directed RNA polymerase specialized sigma24 family protein
MEWGETIRLTAILICGLYRKRTVGMLRRYMRFSIETGRLPSLVGREFFRAKVTYYTATTFEDRVIFVRDVENCLNRLEYWDQQLIARIILQEHGQEQAARILHCGLRTVERRLPQVLDLLSEDFLRVGLLTGLPSRREFSQ